MPRALARLALKPARTAHLRQLVLQFADAPDDQAPVDFKLQFTGAAEKAEAAALTLKMGPAAYQPRALVIERGQLHLSWPSRVRARSPKNSRISPVRSITLHFHSRSRLRCCTGLSA